jgi:hypothetical protein
VCGLADSSSQKEGRLKLDFVIRLTKGASEPQLLPTCSLTLLALLNINIQSLLSWSCPH